MKNLSSRIALLLTLLWLGACSVNPVTGENELSLLSPQQEIALGEQNYGPAQQMQGGRYVVDPGLDDYVSAVGQKLARVSHQPELPYAFTVLNNGVPNAWAMPGGKIAINRGLLTLLEDESQLAAVLGHEIVHAAARHTAQQQTQSTLLGVGVLATGIALSNKDPEMGALATGVLGVGAQAWQARYGRQQELEADKYGIEYMVEAGYDPQGAVELQQTFVKLSEGRQANWLDSFFASHPPSQERVEANRQLAAQYPGGERKRQDYQRAIAQLKKDEPAYEAYQRGLAALGDGQLDRARALVDQALKQQPKETLFWELKGRIAAQEKDYRASRQAFDRAVEANPTFFRPLVYRGLAERQLDNHDAAERDLKASMQLLPTQIASFYLGEYALAKNQRQQAIEYFQVAAQGGGEIGQAAQARLQELQPQPQQ